MNTDNLDLLVEAAAIQGQLTAGVSPALVAARSKIGTQGVAILASRNGKEYKRAKSPKWMPEEDDFLKSNLGILSEEKISESLGRSVIAVHLRWKRDLSLTAPTKRRDILTAEQIANGLGSDSKSIHKLIDRGILKGYRLPLNRIIRVVYRVTFIRFITNPMNWIYFHPDRVGNRPPRRASLSYDKKFWKYVRRLVKKRQSLWKDEWWSIGKVARYHGVDHRAVNKAIHEGRVKAKDWGNWWILKSHATDPSLCLQHWTGKGGKGHEYFKLSPCAEVFLILAKAVGMMESEIAKLMKLGKKKRIQYLLSRMHLQGRIQRVIKENRLKVLYDKKTGEVFADWKMHLGRFPYLARRMCRIPKTREEKKYICRVKRKAEIYGKM